MNDQNKVIICGRLGKDPELKYTSKQEAVCNFTLAENVEGEDNPIWHRGVVWGKQAEQCKVHLRKGRFVFVHGQNKRSSYTTRNGLTRNGIELKAYQIGISL